MAFAPLIAFISRIENLFVLSVLSCLLR
jgi:hypothetical protein